ncbi:hypothetical protein K450DRAFT_282681 [Umbelopsis ramanniana AG]|uniref:Uncharacterized protein n=1 Tax=Umbelopsis ramanniana AG TaxID=1314678 RepID=A0AAD5HBX5_UMBRA|nr:uncharacterized protein K450DRAFT_282681 [Umbelopsis ramanniana AG]KAI8577289.1 hypothetical protein K450DRAFT_282681 [Umbelopsis ramanniana AG]
MVALSALPTIAVITAIVTTVSVSLITLGTVVFIYRRKRTQSLIPETSMVKTELSALGLEEGVISPMSEPESMVHATFPDEKKETQVAEQEVSQVSSDDEGEETKEENSDNEFEFKRTSSQDSACFTDPICRSCFNDTYNSTESDDMDEEDIVTTACVHGLKRDWTRIEVVLPEVYTSSQESILDAVVSASTA